MELLYPLGMLAAAAISVPLLIHLWNTPKRRVLKVGSIGLMALTTRRSSKQIRISNWLLLALRSLLLILIAFILALPYVQKKYGKDPFPGWLLIEKQDLRMAYQQSKATVDSLLQLGYELRDYSKDFKEMTLEDTVSSIGIPNDGVRLNRLAALNEVVPAGYKVYLFSDRRLINLPSNIPPLSFDFQWHEIERTDTVSNWVSNFKGKEFNGRSTPIASWYTKAKAKTDAAPIQVLIHSEQGTADAKYVRAALQTIRDYSGRKINADRWTFERHQLVQPDLVFWLSGTPVPEILLKPWKDNSSLFTYAVGKAEALVSTINVYEEGTVKLPADVLHLRIPGKQGEQGLWTDSYGQSLLTVSKFNGFRKYVFYSRFNPSWTELVWNEQFVKMMMPVVLHSDVREFGYEQNADDQRLVSQQPFRRSTQAPLHTPTADSGEPIQRWFWIAALVVLVMERILSMFSKGRTEL